MSRLLVAVFVLSGFVASQGNHVVNVPCCAFTDSVSGTSLTTVPVGTTVEWRFSGFIGHTVTSGQGSTSPNAGALFDQPLNAASPIFTFTFNTPGTVAYFCRPHEITGMTGTVVVTVQASATTTGTGCVGSSGQPFTLSAQGLPTLGNLAFAMNLTNGPANTSASIFGSFGLSPVPIPVGPCTVFLDLTSLLALIGQGVSPLGPFPLGAGGAGSAAFPIVNSAALAGLTIDLQAAAPDANVAGGLVLSNALTIVLGN